MSPALIGVGALIALVSAFSTVFAVRQRFKRSSGEDRQLARRWIAYVASVAGIFFALQWILGFVFEALGREDSGPSNIFGATALTLAVGIPAAYLIAIFRYGLWELDVVSRRRSSTRCSPWGSPRSSGCFLAAPSSLSAIGGDPESLLPSSSGCSLLSASHWSGAGPPLGEPHRLRTSPSPYEVMSEFADRVAAPTRWRTSCPGWRSCSAKRPARGREPRLAACRRPVASRGSWPADAPAVAAHLFEGGQLPTTSSEAFEVRHQGDLLGALTIVLAARRPRSTRRRNASRGTWRRRPGSSYGTSR